MKLRDYLLTEEYDRVGISANQSKDIEKILDKYNVQWEYGKMRKSYTINNIKNSRDFNAIIQKIADVYKGDPEYDKIEITVKGTTLSLDDFI